MKRHPLALHLKRVARSVAADLEPDEDWEPVAVWSIGDELVPTPLGPLMHDKDRLGIALGAMVRTAKPETVGMVHCCWYVLADRDGPVDMSVLPSQSPKRREGVLVTVLDADGHDTYLAEITRRPARHPRLAPFVPWGHGEFSGRMVDGIIAALRANADESRGAA